MFYIVQYVAHGGTVLSNFTVKLPNCRKIDFYDLLKLIGQGRKGYGNLIVLDELQTWTDSRTSMSKENRFATYFLFQSAKLGYDIIYTSQANMRTDVDYRALSDVRFLAEKKDSYFEYTVLDSRFIDVNIPTGRKLIIPFATASKFWNYYDTYEAVQPVGYNKMLQELEKWR